jgi:hypothetical protein
LLPLVDDTLEDKDGDGVLNAFEYMLGTAAGNKASRPVHVVGSRVGSRHFLVDPVTGGASSEDNVFATLAQAAAQLASGGLDVTLIDLLPGVHEGSTTFNASGKRVQLARGGNGGPVVMNGANGSATLRVTAGTLIAEGIVLTHRTGQSGRGLEVSGGASLARLVNCVVRGNSVSGRGGGVYVDGSGRADLIHTTVAGNTCTDPAFGRGLHIAGGTINLVNSISWNPASASDTSPEYGLTSGAYIAQSNIVRGGVLPGMINADPKLTHDGHLLAGSPAINAGTAATGVGRDVDGEARPSGVAADIGADEYVDTDSDDLPDLFETRYFGNLESSAEDDNDGDRLNNYYEYLFGFDPLDADSSGDSAGDLWAALTSSRAWYYPAEWLADPDKDGLPTWREIWFETDPANPDSNGDGIFDGPSVEIGLDPLNTDHDADGMSNASELRAGTDPFLKDTDRDGVNDPADAFPLDPFASSFNPVPGDVAAPVIRVHQPPDAVKL